MAQIFQPELTDSFEIKSNTISQSDNVTKTIQEIYNYGVNSNYGNCFILYDNANNFLQNKGGYQIRYFTLTPLLTPRKIYLGSSNYLYNNGAIAGGTKIQHAIGVAVRMRSGEYETINVATLSLNGNSYSTIVNTSGNFTTSTGGLSGTTVYVNEDDYGSDYYSSWYGSGLHSGYDEVIYIDPSIYDELYIDGQLVPKANATIRVNYYLPDSDYEYARLTYKKNDKPESVNDGTIVPISPSDSYIDIENLVEGKSYYFKIFTNKSESEAFPYTVEVDPVPPEYKQYIDYINGSGFNFKNYPITYGDRIVQPIVPTVISQMSWVVGKNYARWDKIYPSTPITVKLTGDTTHITVTYEGYSNSEYTKCNDYNRIMYGDKSYDSQNPENILIGDNVYSAYYGMNYYSVGNFTTEFAINNADNIQQALIFFTTRFKNIIIYVNNELWSNPF